MRSVWSSHPAGLRHPLIEWRCGALLDREPAERPASFVLSVTHPGREQPHIVVARASECRHLPGKMVRDPVGAVSVTSVEDHQANCRAGEEQLPKIRVEVVEARVPLALRDQISAQQVLFAIRLIAEPGHIVEPFPAVTGVSRSSGRARRASDSERASTHTHPAPYGLGLFMRAREQGRSAISSGRPGPGSSRKTTRR